MKTIFVTYAVKEEYISLSPEGYELIPIRTGIGKTKSATTLTQSICECRPDFVLNVGTAGTLIHNLGDIFITNQFVDRDYEATQLPGIEYEIDVIKLLEGYSLLEEWLSSYKNRGICSTGDTFVTQAGSFSGDVIDMEGYAQAYVCKKFNIPFLSIKYITDIIGSNSVEHWENKLADARKGLSDWFVEHHFLSTLKK